MAPRLHVLLTKEELDGERLPGKVVVVVDVLFATTSIAAALAHGAAEVVPALDAASARAEAASRPPGSWLLAGERDAVTLPGFADPTPLALLRLDLAGRALVYATTNGTVALRRAAGAAAVYAGAIANGRALAGHLARRHAGETVLLACAGSAGRFNLEDFCGAGFLAALLLGAPGAAWEPSDAALAARELALRGDTPALLAAGRVGQMMRERGLDAEVAYASRSSHLAVVPELRDGAVRAASPAP